MSGSPWVSSLWDVFSLRWSGAYLSAVRTEGPTRFGATAVAGFTRLCRGPGTPRGREEKPPRIAEREPSLPPAVVGSLNQALTELLLRGTSFRDLRPGASTISVFVRPPRVPPRTTPLNARLPPLRDVLPRRAGASRSSAEGNDQTPLETSCLIARVSPRGSPLATHNKVRNGTKPEAHDLVTGFP